jgi:hypothetical protein
MKRERELNQLLNELVRLTLKEPLSGDFGDKFKNIEMRIEKLFNVTLKEAIDEIASYEVRSEDEDEYLKRETYRIFHFGEQPE